jgi:uncharacterized protein (TIGR02001 family)
MFALPPFDPGVEVVISSQGMSKGIKQSDGPQFVPKFTLRMGDVQLGGQWKNVTSTAADGEAAIFANATHKFGALAVTAGAAYKFQTNVKMATDSDCFEFTGAVARSFGKLSLKAGAVYSPDDLGKAKRSLYVEGGPAFDVTKTLRLSANLGHRTRQNGVDYTSFNIGASKALTRALSVDLRFYQTNRADLDDVYKRRVVIAGKLAF